MSTYQDFLAVVTKLYKGEVFEITVEWCTAKGLVVDQNIVKSWGHSFTNDYKKYNCTTNGTGTDNHHSYTKN